MTWKLIMTLLTDELSLRTLEIHSKRLPHNVKIINNERERGNREMWGPGQRMQKGEIRINQVFACKEHSDIRPW